MGNREKQARGKMSTSGGVYDMTTVVELFLGHINNKETKRNMELTSSSKLFYQLLKLVVTVLRSKGLKDATCVGWFGDDWDCLVGCPPKAMIM